MGDEMSSGVLGRPEKTDQPAGRFCVWCGTEFAPAARYCGGCGRSVADSVQLPHSPATDGAEDPVSETDESTILDVFDHGEHVRPMESPRSVRRVPGTTKRWIVIGAGAVALLLLVAVVATFAFRSAQERPVRAAMESAQQTFDADVRRLSSASDMTRVQTAGQRFASDLSRLEAQEKSLAASDHELARAARLVVAAQVSFASAAAELSEIPQGDFTWWGPVHSDLDKAARELRSASKGLAAVDDDAAPSGDSVTGALRNLEKVVGADVAGAAGARLSELLGRVADASATAGVRSAASTANLEAAAVKTSAESLPEQSSDAERLRALSTVYSSLGALAVLDADHLDEWATLRAPLTSALAASGPEVLDQSVGRTAVSNVQRIVDRGKRALADWKAEYDTAVEARAQDLSNLRSYKANMDSQLRTYSALRAELSRWVDKVDAPDSHVTYDEGYRVLAQASTGRYEVREKMSSLTVPSEASDAHRGLMTVLDDAIAAVDAAFEGTSDAEWCITSCYYRDTEGWRRFTAESARITGAFDWAVKSWEAGVSAADRAIAGRTLPKQPVV
jgi:hypothetical protein